MIKNNEKSESEYMELVDWVAKETIKLNNKLKAEGRLPLSRSDPNMKEYEYIDEVYRKGIAEIKEKYGIDQYTR